MRKVIRGTVEPESVVHIDGFNEAKLYFSKSSTGLYKLHRCREEWAFIGMYNSKHHSCGWFPTVSKALKAQMEFGTVFEFDTLREAMEELL